MNTTQVMAALGLPPLTPAAIALLIAFGVPLVVLCSFFVHMCGVLKRQDEAKENGDG